VREEIMTGSTGPLNQDVGDRSHGEDPGGSGEDTPITLRQASWALLFVVLYVAVFLGAVLAVGLLGVVDFTPGVLVVLLLPGATAACMLALYVHLIRKHRLGLDVLGFRRLTPRMFHLFWQIPGAIVSAAFFQQLFLAVLSLLNVDIAAASSSNDALAGIAELPAATVVIAFIVIVVLTPLWEEVLFRGAFLSGFLRRFKPLAAILLSAALFASVHLVLLSVAYLFALGVALALLRRFHRNLWAPVLLHATNNALVMLLIFTLA
jgi:uncharacterized protein